VLGVHGGDGSVAATADAARRAGRPLLVLPGGTFNHFARTAGVPTIEAAFEALRTGAGRRVDVVELSIDEDEPITVLNAASVGVYPAFVATRETMERSLGKPVAAVVAAIRVLARAETINVSIDGRPARVWSLAVSAGRNSSASMVPLQRRRLDDPVLDIRILHAFGRMPRLRGIVALAFGGRASSLLDRLPLRSQLATIESFTTSTVRLEVHPSNDGPIVFAHDGEVSMGAVEPKASSVASITIVPGGLDVYSLGPAAE
jgi:diacylglycerol kinase family enzyme